MEGASDDEFVTALVINGKLYEISLTPGVRQEVEETANELGITFDEMVERIAAGLHDDIQNKQGEPS